MPEEPDIQQALLDFDATIKAKPNLTDEELFQKFPEFGNDVAKLQSAKDYSATLNSGKYKGVEEFNSKFPEFFAVEKKSEVGVVDGSKSQSSGSVTDLYKQGTTETAVTELAGKQEPKEPVRQNKEALLYEKKYGDMPELVQQKNIEIAEKTKWKPTLTEEENLQLNEARKDLAEKEKYLASYQSPVNAQDKIDPVKFQKETDVANAKMALEKMETVAKFRDTDNYIAYYDTETFEPVAVPKAELGQFFQDFMDEEFGNRRDIVNRGIDANEFKDKKFNELDESAQRVVLNAFAAKYLPKDDLQSYLSSQNLSFDLGKAPHAGNQFVKGALGTTAAILDGAEGNIAEADVLNANYVKAQSGMITKSEYERKYSELAIDITSKIKNGQYVTTNKLPGIQPLETKMQGGFGNPEATPTYIYSEDQIQKWLSKAPTYEETMNGAESPYLYENGLLGNWAEGIKKVADSRMSNPAYKENLLLTDIPQATGSSVPFIVSTILSRGTNIPANILTAVTGGLANSSGVYEDAINSGATASEAKKAYYLAFGIGTTEAIPLDRLMDRFAAGTGLGKKAIEVLLQGGEEAIQEGATSLNNSLLARFVYDESQKIGETLKSDAGLGLATGMIMAAGKLVSTSKTATPEQKDLAKKGIEQLQNYLKQRGNVAKEQAKINVEKPVVETKVEPEVVVEEEKIVEPGSGTGGKEPTLEEQMQMELDANPDKRDEILAKYEKKDVKNVEVDKKADIEKELFLTPIKLNDWTSIEHGKYIELLTLRGDLEKRDLLRNLDPKQSWQLYAVENLSEKEAGEILSSIEVETQKADIERRRQEELKNEIWNNSGTKFTGKSFVAKDGNTYTTEESELKSGDKVIKVKDKDGKTVSSAYFTKNEDGTYSIKKGTRVESKIQGIGLASAIYNYFDNNIGKIKRTDTTTDEGDNLWNSNKNRINAKYDAELADLEQQPIQEISEPDTKQAELDAKIEEGKKRLAEAKAKLTAKEEVKVEEPKVETVAVEPVKEEPKDETNTEIPSLSEIKSDVIERNGTKSYIVEKPNVIKGDDTSKMWYKYEGDNGEELYHSELGFDYNMKGEKLPKGSADKLLTDNKKIFEDRNKINEAPKPLLDAILNDEKGWLSRMNESSTLQELEEIEKELQTNGELKKQLLGKEGKDFYSRLNYLRRKEGGAPEQNPISERLSKYGWTVEPQGKDQVVRNANGKIVATVKTKGAKYEIIGNDGAKLMSGNKNVAEAVEKVATKYFMAQEKVAKVETPVETVTVEEGEKEIAVKTYTQPKKYGAEIKTGERYYDSRYGDFYTIEKMVPVEGGDVNATLIYDKGKTRTESGDFLLYHIDSKQHSLSKEQPNVESQPENKQEGKAENTFEEKHGVSIDSINEKAQKFRELGLSNPIEMALTELGFDTREQSDPVMADYVKNIIEGELPKKLPNKKEQFTVEMLPEGEINPQPIEKKVTPLKDKTTKSKAESLKGIVAVDEDRPVMESIFHDKERGALVATDAHKLIIIKDDNIEKQGIFDAKTGKEVDGKYPNYPDVIPQDNPIRIEISIKELRPKLEGMERANKFFADEPIVAKIRKGDTDFFFAPKLLNDVFKVLEQHGHDKVTIELSTPMRALVINTGDITALVMPMYMKEEAKKAAPLIESEYTEAELQKQAEFQRREDIREAERKIRYEEESVDDDVKELAEAEKKLSDARISVRKAKSGEDLNSANSNVEIAEKSVEAKKRYLKNSQDKLAKAQEELNKLKNEPIKPISETPANDAEAVVKGIESDANSESKSKRKRAIKTGTEVIDDKIAEKKEKLSKLKKDRNNLGIGENLGEKNAEMLAAYTDLAILYAQKGIKTAIEFAKELGEDINEFIQEAWDKANSEPVEEIVEEPKPEPKTPETTEEEEPEEKEKALLNRAFKGATEEELQAAIEKHGLTYEVESWEAAKKKARALIDDIGIEAAVQAVKDRVVVGAPAAFVWGEAIDSIHNAITTAETTEEIERLTKLEADLMSEFDKQAREQGRFISALLDVYANSDFQYDLETQIQKYKDNNSGIIPKEVEDKMRELSEQLKDIQAKYEEAKKRNDELEYAENVRNIQDSVNREKGTPMSQSEIDAAIEKGVESELNKAMARLSDTRKKTAKKAIERLDKMYDSLSGMNFDATIGIPVAIVRGGIKTIIAGIKLTGKVADAIESGMKHIQEEYEKQFGKKLPISEYGRVKTFIKDNLKDAGLEVSNRKDKPIKEKDGKIVIPPALIRELVESGLTDPNELTQAVLQEVQKSLPEATERQVRDAISNYGRTVNQSQEDIDIEIRKIKRAQRIISALEDIANKKRPLRSGLQRDKLDAEERALQKQLKEALKSLPPDTALEAKQLKTTLDVIEKRLLNQIEDLQREIDAEERTVKERKEIPYTDRIKELIAERDAKKAEHEEIFGKPELTAEQRLEIAIKAINRAAAKVEERIRKGELTTTPNVSLTSAEKEAAKKRLADARAQLMEMQELAGIPEQKRLEQAKNNAKRRIAELQNKIDIGDFAKKKQKKIIKDDELRTLIAEKNRIQEKFNKLQYEAELRNRSKTQKVIDALLEVWGITRALRATAEFSFMLIQGGFYAVSHPLTSMKALSVAFSHLTSTSRSERFAEQIKTQDWYEGAREDKLAITEVDYKLSAREELFLNGWVNHIWNAIGLPLKLVSEKAFQRWKLASFPKAFERSNVGAMNLIRITRYLKGVEMLEAQGKTRETHPQDYKNVADMVNTFTGRASLGGLENNKATSKLLTTIFFSPKMWASTLKTFTPYAFIHFGKMSSAEFENTGNFGKDKKVGKRQVSVAQKMAMADYMKYVGLTTAAVMAIALRYNNDDDEDTSVELDPRSSDFLKIKIGNTRVDPWGGRIQMIVLQARLLAESMNRMTREEGWAAKLGWRDIPSYKRTSSGELVRLGEGYTDTMGGLLTTMTKNKLAPSAALVNKWLFAKLDKEGNTVDKFGNPYEPSDELVNNLYPIYIETIKELYRDQPYTVATFLTFYAFLGGGAQTYEPPKPKAKASGPVKPIAPIKPAKPVKPL